MNNDLISRSALIEKIESTYWYHISESGNLAKGANSELDTPLFKADDIFTALENAPAVDAVIPVLCTDCKHWLKDVPGCTDFVGRCELANYMVGATGYCVYGDRRADDETD